MEDKKRAWILQEKINAIQDIADSDYETIVVCQFEYPLSDEQLYRLEKFTDELKKENQNNGS
jgi:hypothetical protein